MSRTAFIDIGDPGAPVGSPPWCKYAHGVLCSSKRRTDSEVRCLKYDLLEFKNNERWKQLTDKKGKPFLSWEDYLQYPEPDGLGMSPASARLVIEELDDSRLLGDVLGEHKGGQPGNKNAAKNDADNISIVPKPRRHGTSRAYILARLDRDGLTNLAAKVRAGELSANAAATKAGWRKDPDPEKTILKLLPKLNADQLARVKKAVNDL